MSEQHKCLAKVRLAWGRYSVCGKNAKFDRDGKHYCGMHDPVAVETKRLNRSAKFTAQWNAEIKASKDAKDKQQELERNAARYLFLRDSEWIDDAIAEKLGIKYGFPETVDAAVDAEIAKGKP